MGNPGSRFAGIVIFLLFLLLIILLVVSRYKKINPTPQLDRKGMAAILDCPFAPRQLDSPVFIPRA